MIKYYISGNPKDSSLFIQIFEVLSKYKNGNSQVRVLKTWDNGWEDRNNLEEVETVFLKDEYYLIEHILGD